MSDDLVQAAQRLAESSYKLLKRTMESKSDSELEKIANDGFFSSYSSEEKELARSILRERGESSAAKDTTITARHNTGKSLSSDEIFQAVLRVIVDQLGVNPDDVKLDSSFVDDLGADSLDTVELVMALEEKFDTEIPDEDAEKITTVRSAIDYIKAHV